MNWLYSPQPPQSPHRALSMMWRVACDCLGLGWGAEVVAGTEDDYIPDYNEKYCDCEAGRWRRIHDGWPDADLAEWYAQRLAALDAVRPP
jgi:hypothetical protein